MRTVALSEAKAHLSALVDEAATTHEIIQITRHGHGAAVIMSADDLDSLHETLAWLSQPGVREDVEGARAAAAAGRAAAGADLRARYGLPPL
jgi:prevent-host-death family protein